jgi:hypothetical protein
MEFRAEVYSKGRFFGLTGVILWVRTGQNHRILRENSGVEYRFHARLNPTMRISRSKLGVYQGG